MSTLTLTFRSLFIRNERISTFSIGGLMLVATAIMGLISLASLNDKAMKGHLLTKLESERQELVTDGEVTDMLTLRARSMDEIEAKATTMVKPAREDITYVLPVAVVAQN